MEQTVLAYVTTWLRLNTDCRGVTAIEYGMIVALIAVVISVVVTTLGTNLSTEFGTIKGSI
jgi:pilus assembly protein Flp/PilA